MQITLQRAILSRLVNNHNSSTAQITRNMILNDQTCPCLSGDSNIKEFANEMTESAMNDSISRHSVPDSKDNETTTENTSTNNGK